MLNQVKAHKSTFEYREHGHLRKKKPLQINTQLTVFEQEKTKLADGPDARHDQVGLVVASTPGTPPRFMNDVQEKESESVRKLEAELFS